MENTKFESDFKILRTHSEYAQKYGYNYDDKAGIYKPNYSVRQLFENSNELAWLFGWYGNEVDPSDYFHPQAAGCIKLDDARCFGIRCDHLIWIDYYDLERYKTLLIGNHKGATAFVVITYNEKLRDQEEYTTTDKELDFLLSLV